MPKLLVKSLDQHNLEIRAEERNEVVEIIYDWVSEKSAMSYELYDKFVKKLTELKGDTNGTKNI